MRYTKEALLKLAKLNEQDLEHIHVRRKKQNQLGFAYQLAFVRLHNRFPNQEPLEVNQEIANYISIQLGLSAELIKAYGTRRKTVSEHQEQIRSYLGLQRFSDSVSPKLEQFIFEQACQLEQTGLAICVSFLLSC